MGIPKRELSYVAPPPKRLWALNVLPALAAAGIYATAAVVVVGAVSLKSYVDNKTYPPYGAGGGSEQAEHAPALKL